MFASCWRVFVAVGIPCALFIDINWEVFAVGIDNVAAWVNGRSVSISCNVFREDVICYKHVTIYNCLAAEFVRSFHGCVLCDSLVYLMMEQYSRCLLGYSLTVDERTISTKGLLTTHYNYILSDNRWCVNVWEQDVVGSISTRLLAQF